MEKTLDIGAKKVRFESKGSTPLRYKKQFGNEFFVDLMKMESLFKINKDRMTHEEVKSLDMEVLYNICWVLAKTADQSIPEPLEWLDMFEEFPLLEILPELQELIISSLKSKKK